jgi:hypothetical protein
MLIFVLITPRWEKCEKGLKCNKCHTTVERLYHPDKYKRIFCDVTFLILYPSYIEAKMQQIGYMRFLPFPEREDTSK